MLSVSLTRKVSRLQGADGIFGKGGTDAKVFITLHDEDGQSSPEYALNGELQPGEGKSRDDRKPPEPLTKQPPRRSEPPAPVSQSPRETLNSCGQARRLAPARRRARTLGSHRKALWRGAGGTTRTTTSRRAWSITSSWCASLTLPALAFWLLRPSGCYSSARLSAASLHIFEGFSGCFPPAVVPSRTI